MFVSTLSECHVSMTTRQEKTHVLKTPNLIYAMLTSLSYIFCIYCTTANNRLDRSRNTLHDLQSFVYDSYDYTNICVVMCKINTILGQCWAQWVKQPPRVWGCSPRCRRPWFNSPVSFPPLSVSVSCLSPLQFQIKAKSWLTDVADFIVNKCTRSGGGLAEWRKSDQIWCILTPNKQAAAAATTSHA